MKERVPAKLKNALKTVHRMVRSDTPSSAPPPKSVAPAAIRTENAGGYQNRRETNLARLRQVDLLIAQSTRVGEIYRALGATSGNLHTLNLTLAHLHTIRPNRFSKFDGPMRFITLNGCYTRPKGAHILLEAMGRLAARGLSSRGRRPSKDHPRGRFDHAQSVNVPACHALCRNLPLPQHRGCTSGASRPFLFLTASANINRCFGVPDSEIPLEAACNRCQSRAPWR